MLYYMGMRREEACGLAIDDIMTSPAGIPFVRIRPNRFRKLKTLSSERDVPFHSEVLRVGVMEYSALVATHGSDRFFPDLFSETSKSSLGDKLYKELEPELEKADLDFHQFRHHFITKLEEAGAQEKVIQDLVGHSGKNITSEIYTDDASLNRKLAAILLLPNLTSEIKKADIRLLPWIIDKRPMPGTIGARKAAQAS